MHVREVWDILRNVGAVITESHIVYSSGKHGTIYINKDALYPHITETSRLCHAIAHAFMGDKVEVVIGPAVGGVILAQWTAHNLARLTFREVLPVYAERGKATTLSSGWAEGPFVIKRGYDKLVAEKNVLVVEDVLTTGGSAKEVVEAVRKARGNVVGLGALVNRGGVTAKELGDVPKLLALLHTKLDAWNEQECPLCELGIPINTSVGHGREFLARRAQEMR